jgi:hypothetical protein
MLSPSASIDPITVSAFAPLFAVLSQVQPVLDEPGQVQALGQHRRRERAGVRHQVAFAEPRGDPAQVVVCSHSAGALPSGDP